MRQAVPSRVRAAAGPAAPGTLRLVPVAGTVAAFTARAHGNVSFLVGGGDPFAARLRLGPLVDTPAPDTVFMEQVHGPAVAVVTRADGGRGVGAHADALAGVDALVTAEVGLALAVLTADCVPVLLAADGAVGAVHAGRAGLLAGVVERALEAMANLGAPPDAVTAVIGPAIGGCCYEIPDELARRAWEQIPDLSARTAWDTPSLDLPAGTAAVLRRAGVGRVGLIGACTRGTPERWFSHRASTDGREPHAEQGRQASLIARTTHTGDKSAPLRLPGELTWLS